MKEILNPIQELYLGSVRREPDSLIKEMEQFAEWKKVPILNWKAAELLEIFIRLYHPQKVLEIGMAIGYSSILIARCLRKKGILHTIEKSTDNIKLATEFINRSGIEEKIKILEGDALKIIPSLEKKYDFIFLDADKQDYEKLFHYSLILMKKGGVLFIDNLLWHGYVAAKSIPAEEKKSTDIIRGFNRIFLNTPSLQSTILPIGDGIGIGIKIS